MRLTFSGAAGCVTGSQHLLESGGKRFLLDCGMFQGRRKEAEKKNKTLPFDANSIDAVILSHAHIDHSGRLPFLVKNGFRGPIYTNPATIDLCHAMLRDTAHILESDAAFVNKHHPDEEPVEPLFTMQDAEETLALFQPVRYRTPTPIGGNLTMESFDAGHILGSSAIVLRDGHTPATLAARACRSFAIPNRSLPPITSSWKAPTAGGGIRARAKRSASSKLL